MDKQTRQLLILAVVIGGVWWMSTGGVTPPAQVVTQAGAPVTTDGVTVYTGTPTLEWYARNAVTGKEVDVGNWYWFRVTINGTQKDYDEDSTANLAIGDGFKVCVLPNASYYAKCESGTITSTVTKVTLNLLALGSDTAYVNNDPENATSRNSLAAVDTLGAGDTDTPTVCFQGATANASFGDGQFLVVLDYNSTQLAAPPVLSVGTKADSMIPATYARDSNYTASTAYLVTGNLTNTDTVCGSMTVVNGATNPVNQSGVKVTPMDHFGYRNTVTDALEFGFKIATSGADTNSATDTNTTYYLA